MLWSNGTINPNKTKINEDVYLVKENKSFSIYCVQTGVGYYSRRGYQELVASKVDSIIISYKYGTAFHGLNNLNNKFEWFYINVSRVKNISNGFKNAQEVTVIIGESYLDSIMSADETWNKFN